MRARAVPLKAYYNICLELVPILDAIIKSQWEGICEMKRVASALLKNAGLYDVSFVFFEFV